jgi:hypothetical protein
MDVFVIRCVLGDLDAMAVVEVSVRLIARRLGSQAVRPAQIRRPGGLVQPAMMCG